MSLKDRTRWEVQWHPASGAGIRRVVLTWRGARHLTVALGLAGMVVVAGGSLAGLDGFLTPFAVEAARRENRSLRAQQGTLREQAYDLAGRLFEGVERGRHMARLAGTPGRAWEGRSLRLPARDAGDEAILAWFLAEGTRLDAIGKELTAERIEMGVLQASVPAPADTETGSERNAAVQVADLGSAGRQTAAPAKR